MCLKKYIYPVKNGSVKVQCHCVLLQYNMTITVWLLKMYNMDGLINESDIPNLPCFIYRFTIFKEIIVDASVYYESYF